MTRERAGRAFLAASIFGALNTINAYRPLARSGNGTLPVMAAGDLTAELPLHTIGGQQLLSLAFLRKGALRTWTGRAGLAVSIASWVGLAGLHREARRSERVLEDALVEALGAYRQRIVAPRAAPVDVPLTRRQVAIPGRGAARTYTHTRDVAYGDAGVRNLLDVWRRRDLPADARAPVIVQVHGGAWTIGEKTGQAYPLLSHLAERGWVAASITYRRGRGATWPDHIVDVKRAIAWVKANIAEHGGDPAFVAVTGGSAGGHLSALAALTNNEPVFQPGFEEADTTVHAAVPLYGVYDFVDEAHLGVPAVDEFLERFVMRSKLADDRERWEQASPMSWVHAGAPPFFVIHGRNDVVARAAQAREFVRLLREKSDEPVAYAELPRAQHAFDMFSSVRAVSTVRAIERFLDTVYCDRVQPPAVS
jgi:acetyl esterase/lipase